MIKIKLFTPKKLYVSWIDERKSFSLLLVLVFSLICFPVFNLTSNSKYDKNGYFLQQKNWMILWTQLSL